MVINNHIVENIGGIVSYEWHADITFWRLQTSISNCCLVLNFSQERLFIIIINAYFICMAVIISIMFTSSAIDFEPRI